jgi:hypothetical protein
MIGVSLPSIQLYSPPTIQTEIDNLHRAGYNQPLLKYRSGECLYGR